MPKKIKFESFVYRFLVEADLARKAMEADERVRWERFLRNVNFRYDNGLAVVSWGDSEAERMGFALREPELYERGDSEKHVARQQQCDLLHGDDPIRRRNSAYFRQALASVARQAGVHLQDNCPEAAQSGDGRSDREEAFHDQWAASENLGAIEVRRNCEACTSPELRFIRAELGSLANKRLLDVGCGLGEASVYFALEGADVTAMDISQGMLDAASQLARLNGVKISIRKASADRTQMPSTEIYDVIYAGNLLHHVDIKATLDFLKPQLAPGGVFISWDPIAYNPVINIYRAIATKVRTPDEHPLRLSDLRLFRREFRDVRTRFFWLTSLVVFLYMALIQRRNPNRERFWKAVVNESERWEPVFRPLSKLDDILTHWIPPLRWLCWNVVIIARSPKTDRDAGRA